MSSVSATTWSTTVAPLGWAPAPAGAARRDEGEPVRALGRSPSTPSSSAARRAPPRRRRPARRRSRAAPTPPGSPGRAIVRGRGHGHECAAGGVRHHLRPSRRPPPHRRGRPPHPRRARIAARPAPRRSSRASWIGAASPSSRSPASSTGRRSSPPRACRRTPASGSRSLGAVLLYALATLVRGERWQRLLADEGGTPSRRRPRAQRHRLHGQQPAARARGRRDPRRADGAARRAADAQRGRHAARRAAARRRPARRDLRDRRLRAARRGRRRQGRDRAAGRRRASPAAVSPTCWCAATSGSWASSRRSPRPRSGCAAPTTGCGCWA